MIEMPIEIVEVAEPVPWEPIAIAAMVVLLFAGVRLAWVRAKVIEYERGDGVVPGLLWALSMMVVLPVVGMIGVVLHIGARVRLAYARATASEN